MINLKPGTRIWIAGGFTDLRRGFQGLSSIVETVLEQAPFSGHVFVFRGKRGDLIELLWFDGDGLCLLQKRLERGRTQQAERWSLTRAQVSMLLEDIEDQSRRACAFAIALVASKLNDESANLVSYAILSATAAMVNRTTRKLRCVCCEPPRP